MVGDLAQALREEVLQTSAFGTTVDPGGAVESGGEGVRSWRSGVDGVGGATRQGKCGQSLSAEALWSLHTLLKAHYEGDGKSPLTWTQIRLFLLPKMRNPKDWDEFRGICLLNVVSKLFMSGVMILMRDLAKAHLGTDWHESSLTGFEQHNKCEDLLMCLQSRVAMAAEWPRQHPIIVASADTKQAFDFVTPQVVAGCMEHWKCPAALTRSLVRESSGTTAEVVCSGLPCTPEFVMESSIRQGGVESPWCFNLVIRTIYHEQRDLMTSRGTRTPLLGSVPMLGWACNILFMGDSVEAAQHGSDAFTAGMHSKGMRWKPTSMQFMRVVEMCGDRDDRLGKHHGVNRHPPHDDDDERIGNDTTTRSRLLAGLGRLPTRL